MGFFHAMMFIVLEHFYLATCGYNDNSCKIINIDSGTVHQHLYFHKDIVDIICTTKDKAYLFSGSKDGLIVKWRINFKNYPPAMPEWSAWDYSTKVVSMDACQELDIVASASFDNQICLRTISTGKFIRLIKPNTKLNSTEHTISKIMLSYRGYLILAKQKEHLETNDIILVYSINGEFINATDSEDCINSVIIDESGYMFIVGGKTDRLLCYDLISLEFNDLGLNLVQNREIFSDNGHISSLVLFK